MVCIQLGSNVGKRRDTLNKAKEELLIGVEIISEGSVYETEAWGVKNQNAFYNQLILVKTELSPFALLKMTQNIEQKMGRVKDKKWGPRIIDIDIIYYGSKVIYSPTLKIPHEFMSQRNFVLKPLLEIAPAWYHPLFRKNVTELSKICKDNSEVKRIEINVE